MAPKQKPGRSKQDYGTPPEFLAAVKKRLAIDEFDVDLAASHKNTVVELSYYTKQDNALVQDWECGEGWNWLNPPFARIEPWVKRAYEMSMQYGVKTAVLVPAGVGSNWWRDWVHQKAAIQLLNGRITFLNCPPNPRTGKVDAYPKDCALLLYSPYMTEGYDVWSWRE